MEWMIKQLYHHSKANNKPLLMNSNFNPTYPTLYEGFDRNFIEDYKTNFAKYDRIFALKFSSKIPYMLEEFETATTAYNEWVDYAESIFQTYIEEWARIYYALRENYNPLYNVDGETDTRTFGKTEGLTGTDTTTETVGATHTEENFGNSKTTSKDYHVPIDSENEKHTDSNIIETDHILNETDTNEHENEHSTQYGKENNVDYTVHEKRFGNIGVTKSSELANDETKLRLENAFFDLIFKTISEELTIW